MSRYQLANGNVICAEQSFIDANYPGAVLLPDVPAAIANAPRRVTKLAFVGRLGADFRNILSASKTSVDIEMFVRMLDWATPDPDGTSVDLDDVRVVNALNTLEAGGIIAAGRAAEILA